MLILCGDIHGEVNTMKYIIEKATNAPKLVALIQVGDFGWYPDIIPGWQRLNPPFPIYFIDGNHEYHPYLQEYKEVTEVAPNIFFVPRGTVLELDGKKIGFLGGASSVDKKVQQARGDWFKEECITQEDVDKFKEVESVDLLVTHCPPQWVIKKHLDARELWNYGLSEKWEDPSALFVQSLWERLGDPKMFCGHLHVRIEDRGVRVLDIGECVVVD